MSLADTGGVFCPLDPLSPQRVGCGAAPCVPSTVPFSLLKTSGPAALSLEQIHFVPFPDRVIIVVIRINLALHFFFPSHVTSVTERM